MSFTSLVADKTYLRHFWHPVCTLKEFTASNPSGVGPMAVKLLGEDIVLAQLDGKISAMRDRCAHRFAKLSKGSVQQDEGGDRLACPYHGWQYDGSGVCRMIPACPELPIPKKARSDAYECEIRYDIVWVRLDASYGVTEIPVFSDWEQEGMRVAVVDSYVWQTTAERRWENFTDFSHFAFVHPGTLYDPAYARPPLAQINRVDGELRFSIEPPKEMMDQLPDLAPLGAFIYRCTMPYTINLEIALYRRPERFVLWTTSCPVDDTTCRNFMIIARADTDDDDATHIAFQKVVLAEDQPIIESQFPYDICTEEISVVTDKVSIQYRKWQRELAAAALHGKEEFQRVLLTNVIEAPAVPAPQAQAAAV